MAHAEPEIAELQEFFKQDEWRAIIATVLGVNGVTSIAALYDKEPALCFELHDEICGLRQDITGIGEFEHDMERETM